MSDVFISYARSETEVAGRVARALEEAGFDVWWDHDLAPGLSWGEAIEEQLHYARCVVVLWSADSVGSDWVQEEAAYAKEQGTLLPVLLGNVKIPFGFRRFQTLDLSNWDGRPSGPDFEKLVDAVRRFVSRRA